MKNENVEEPKRKLKPVVFIDSKYRYNGNNDFQQRLLLKACVITSNPKELMKLAGLKTVAEVYRTLDKLALRKEYHAALVRQGIDFDFLIGNLKNLSISADKDNVRLGALQILLKSIGMDKYEDIGETGKSWEELLVEAGKNPDKNKDVKEEQYEVTIPDTPDDELAKIAEEREVGKNIYGED